MWFQRRAASNELRSPSYRPEFRYPNGLYYSLVTPCGSNNETCVRGEHKPARSRVFAAVALT